MKCVLNGPNKFLNRHEKSEKRSLLLRLESLVILFTSHASSLSPFQNQTLLTWLCTHVTKAFDGLTFVDLLWFESEKYSPVFFWRSVCILLVNFVTRIKASSFKIHHTIAEWKFVHLKDYLDLLSQNSPTSLSQNSLQHKADNNGRPRLLFKYYKKTSCLKLLGHRGL